jgi:hypothetical protein
MKLKREELLMKLGAAKQKSPSAWRLVQIEVDKDKAALTYRLDREKLRRQRRREGCYLLRTTLTETDPAKLWSLYLQLVNVEEAFKNLKGDLAIRPIFHQSEKRIGLLLAHCVDRNCGSAVDARRDRRRAHRLSWTPNFPAM